MSKCDSCPVVGACIAETPGWSFACKLAAGDDAERAFVVNRSAIDAGTLIVPPTTDVRPIEDAAESEPPRDWSGWRRATRLGGLNCFYATRAPGCACVQCHAFDRRVTTQDCLECLSS